MSTGTDSIRAPDLGLLDVGEQERRPGGGERSGDAFADSLGSTGDDSHGVGKFRHLTDPLPVA